MPDQKNEPYAAREDGTLREAALKKAAALKNVFESSKAEIKKELVAAEQAVESKAAEIVEEAADAGRAEALSALDAFSEKAAAFFRSAGWQVDVQPFEKALASGLIRPRASNRLDCADGRIANEPGLAPGYALFGGFWAIPALVTRLTLGGLRQAVELLHEKGLEGVVHGDVGGGFNCGAFRLLQSNLLRSLERNRYVLASHDSVIEAILRTLPFKVQRLVLKGEHVEQDLVMSFASGFSPALDPRHFRITADLVDDLKIDRDRFLKMSEEAARLLTDGALRRVIIVRPPEQARPA